MALPKANDTGAQVLEEDVLRAQHYRLLARFLSAAPDAELLELAARLGGDEATDLGKGLDVLARAAGQTTPEAAGDEFDALFVGDGVRGELLPYCSYYLTGFLNEKPLANLRGDMARLGIARADDVTDPEDHIGAICEMMAGLIVGDFGAPLDLAGQKAFFDAHLAPWAEKFFEELEAAESASLYMPVGTIGRVFMGIESTAFQMVA
jgi:TorA maturation chaperone TorD